MTPFCPRRPLAQQYAMDLLARLPLTAALSTGLTAVRARSARSSPPTHDWRRPGRGDRRPGGRDPPRTRPQASEAAAGRITTEAAAEQDRIRDAAKADGVRLMGAARAEAEAARLAAHVGVDPRVLLAAAHRPNQELIEKGPAQSSSQCLVIAPASACSHRTGHANVEERQRRRTT